MSNSGATPNETDDINNLLDKKRLEELAEQFKIPGFSAAYVNKGGSISTMPVGVEANAAGSDVSEDSVFCAASLSKAVFAYLVLRLAAAKQISLDDTLDTFFKNEDIESGVSVSKWIKNGNLKYLTPRMILQHRTGLPIGGPEGDNQFQFEPGTKYGYSGIGIQCLQEAITAKTKKTLEELAKEYVFDHCGMSSNSSFNPTPESPMQKPLIAANSLHTTAQDYAKFVMKWMSDNEIENAFKFDDAFTMRKDPWAIGMQFIEDSAFELTRIEDIDLDSVGWGLGVGLQKKDDVITAFHSGDATDTRAFVAFNLKDKTAIVYLSNSDNGLALIDEISSRTVPVEHGLNYLFQKYGFEREFKDGWEDRQDKRIKTICDKFPPNKPFSETVPSTEPSRRAPLLSTFAPKSPSLAKTDSMIEQLLHRAKSMGLDPQKLLSSEGINIEQKDNFAELQRLAQGGDEMANVLYLAAAENIQNRSKLASKQLDSAKNPLQTKYTKDGK